MHCSMQIGAATSGLFCLFSVIAVTFRVVIRQVVTQPPRSSDCTVLCSSLRETWYLLQSLALLIFHSLTFCLLWIGLEIYSTWELYLLVFTEWSLVTWNAKANSWDTEHIFSHQCKLYLSFLRVDFVACLSAMHSQQQIWVTNELLIMSTRPPSRIFLSAEKNLYIHIIHPKINTDCSFSFLLNLLMMLFSVNLWFVTRFCTRVKS